METKEVKVKKWGNSLGVILPREIVNKQKISEGATIKINVQTKDKTKAGDIFGILKNEFKRSTEDILKEVDEDFEWLMDIFLIPMQLLN